MTMMAFDADDPATDNAALRYNIVRQSPGNPSSNMFYIDAERGDIVTAIPAMLLDREVGRLFASLHLRPSPDNDLLPQQRGDECHGINWARRRHCGNMSRCRTLEHAL